MLNIIRHQGNTNQNHNEVSSHTLYDGFDQKFKKNNLEKSSVGDDVEKLEPLHVGRNVKYCSFFGKQYEDSSKY